MILADTSAWIEFIRGTGSPIDSAMLDAVACDDKLCVTEPVLMEVTGGATDDFRERQLRRLLLRFKLLRFDPTVDFAESARLFRACRANGFTPSSYLDCMISAVAIRAGVPVLSADTDFARIAGVSNLRLFEA